MTGRIDVGFDARGYETMGRPEGAEALIDDAHFYREYIPQHIPLTPEIILATVRRQLEQIDDQIHESLAHVEGTRNRSEEIGGQITELRELYETLRAAPSHLRDGETIYVDRLDETDNAGVTNTRDALGITGANDEDVTVSFQALLARHGVSYSGSTEFDLSLIKNEIDTLSEEQRRINSGNEMVMMQLQTLMQQRTQQLQAGSNLLASIDEASKTIVGNLR